VPTDASGDGNINPFDALPIVPQHTAGLGSRGYNPKLHRLLTPTRPWHPHTRIEHVRGPSPQPTTSQSRNGKHDGGALCNRRRRRVAPSSSTMNQQNLSSFIWSVADLLRGDYKQSEYGRVILPFTVLRRLDCVLERTKEAVLKEKEKREAAGLNPEPFLL